MYTQTEPKEKNGWIEYEIRGGKHPCKVITKEYNQAVVDKTIERRNTLDGELNKKPQRCYTVQSKELQNALLKHCQNWSTFKMIRKLVDKSTNDTTVRGRLDKMTEDGLLERRRIDLMEWKSV